MVVINTLMVLSRSPQATPPLLWNLSAEPPVKRTEPPVTITSPPAPPISYQPGTELGRSVPPVMVIVLPLLVPPHA